MRASTLTTDVAQSIILPNKLANLGLPSIYGWAHHKDTNLVSWLVDAPFPLDFSDA